MDFVFDICGGIDFVMSSDMTCGSADDLSICVKSAEPSVYEMFGETADAASNGEISGKIVNVEYVEEV